jgi:multicomponent Na+:H+ antiporter subunit F
MIGVLETLYVIAGVLFAAAALLAVIRIVRGPSILDRLIASDVLVTTLILVLGAEMVINSHTRTIPIMIVLAATAVFSTIAVARFVSKHDAPAGADSAEPAKQQAKQKVKK